MKIIAWRPLEKTKQRRREFHGVVRHWEWPDGALIQFGVHRHRGTGRAWIGKDVVVVQWGGRTQRGGIHDRRPSIESVERVLATMR